MNWIGGARSRAKAQEQLNRSRAHFLPNRPRTQNQLTDGDGNGDDGNSEGEEAEADLGNRSPLQAPPVITRKSRKRRNEDNDWKKDVDYEALGYKLVVNNPVQRRVVPLLEFAEKTFPRFGHMLSLQLSYQMDIARTPAPQPTPAVADAESLVSGGGGEGEALSTPSSFRKAPSLPSTRNQNSPGSESSLTSPSDVILASATPVSSADNDETRSEYFPGPGVLPLPLLEPDYVTTVTSGLDEVRGGGANEDDQDLSNSGTGDE